MEGRKCWHTVVCICKKCWCGVKWTCSRIWEFVTGEWWFWWGLPNGGTIILLRTAQVTFIFYVLGLALRSYLEAGCATAPCDLHWRALLHDDHAETVPWFGAIFAAVWAALYARFASQWSYLAGVYNQMRQTLVSLKDDLDDLKELKGERAYQLDLWKAGFVEDALALHLATKPVFGPFILRTIKGEYSGRVPQTFDNYAHNGEKRRKRLEKRLEKKFPKALPKTGADIPSGGKPIEAFERAVATLVVVWLLARKGRYG